jgi:hypothetical protein
VRASHSRHSRSSLTSVLSIVAARGIWTSAVATGVCGFLTMILFLFCTPADTESILNAPQPFVLVYAQALGRGGATFLTLLATLGLILVSLARVRQSTRFHTAFPEHQHCHCRRLASHLCGCSRWRLPSLQLDWQSHRGRSTSKCRPDHVGFRSSAPLRHPS